MHLAKTALLIALVHCLAQFAQATNLWFMPGDACFPVVLDKSLAEKMHESKHKVLLDYSSLHGGGYFCGYAGYNSIEIQDVPAVWSDSIDEIYRTLRSHSPRLVEEVIDADGKIGRQKETNGFLMFVQNSRVGAVILSTF